MCPNLFNFKCLVLMGCWQRLAQAMATVALVASLATALWLAVRRGWFTRCFACLCGRSRHRLHRQNAMERQRGQNQGHGEEGDSEDGEIPPLPPKKKVGGAEFAAAVYAKQWQHRAGAGAQQRPYREPSEPPSPATAFYGAPSPSAYPFLAPTALGPLPPPLPPQIEMVAGPSTAGPSGYFYPVPSPAVARNGMKMWHNPLASEEEEGEEDEDAVLPPPPPPPPPPTEEEEGGDMAETIGPSKGADLAAAAQPHP